MFKGRWLIALTIVLRLLYAEGANLSAQQPFYGGKSIRIIVGFSPGGGFDAYSRAIARHMGKYIPGNPTIVVENVTGAGSLIAANYTFNQAKPDGLTIGHFIGGLVMGQLFGNPGIQFDAKRFEWIGVPAKVETVCVFSKLSGITSMETWLTSTVPVKLGATGPGSETYDVPKILEAALGLPMQVISGYKGAADVRLAVESGEIAGTCGGWEAMKGGWKAIDAGNVVIVLQALPKASPDLPKVPLAINFAKTEEGRRLIQVGIHDQSDILRLYALPPGTPKERVFLLRKAFEETMNNSDFLGEMKKARLSIDPMRGEELEKIIAGLFKLEPALVTKLKDILTPKK